MMGVQIRYTVVFLQKEREKLSRGYMVCMTDVKSTSYRVVVKVRLQRINPRTERTCRHLLESLEVVPPPIAFQHPTVL